MSENLKKQRDRFLAFAFASADVLLEVSDDGSILFATGALQSITGRKGEELEGENWLNLFSTYEQARMLELQSNLPQGTRCGPFLLNMNAMRTDRKAIVTGIKMPYSRSFFITISPSNELMEDLAQNLEDEFDDSIYNKQQFINAAEDVFNFARTKDIEADVTVFDFGRTETIKEENWAEVIGDIAKRLKTHAVDGKAVGEIADGKLSLIHGHDTNLDEVLEDIKSAIKEKTGSEEDPAIETQTLEGDLANLSAEEAEKAFQHSIEAIAEGEAQLGDAKTLGESLRTLVTDNENKMAELKSYIEQVNFKFHFQPIAHLRDYELSHYEMLCRFNTGNTLDWITFARDSGMAADLDLAVCERAVNHLTRKLGGTRTMYAMNMLPTSLEKPEFLEGFLAHLDKESNMHERLIIEIVDARHLKLSDDIRLFIKELKNRYFQIALDGISTNAKSVELIQNLPCEFVKLDGVYSDLASQSQHERAMVENLVKVCSEKKIKLVAKNIETKEQADMLKSLNVDLGQGHYFGQAENAPAYQAPRD